MAIKSGPLRAGLLLLEAAPWEEEEADFLSAVHPEEESDGQCRMYVR